MPNAYIAGVGMHPFGKYLDKGLKELVHEAVKNAILDADIDPKNIEIAYFANAFAGALSGQHSVRGQVYLRYSGFSEIPIINIENACASGATAVQQAALSVSSGQVDVAIAIGAEKMFVGDTGKTINALASAADVEVLGGAGIQFPALYALKAKEYMEKYGATPYHFAKVGEKNSLHASLNPNAQFKKRLSADDILHSKMIADPLTLFMCSPIADGAAAVIIVSEKYSKRVNKPLVQIRGSVLKSGKIYREFDSDPSVITKASTELYEKTGIAPSEIQMLEVHDAATSVEFSHVEEVGIVKEGTAFKEIEEGTFSFNGKIPMNTSGGLTSKGHPVGATGVAQMIESVIQLRGEAGDRQIFRNGLPKTALCLNTGGRLEDDRAAIAISLLSI